jgi:hypothetical protein
MAVAITGKLREVAAFVFGVGVEVDVAQIHGLIGRGWRKRPGVFASFCRNVTRRLGAKTFSFGGADQGGVLRFDDVISSGAGSGF